MVVSSGPISFVRDTGFSGLTTVVDAISLKGGGAVVLGTQGTANRPVLQFYDTAGSVIKTLDLGINATGTGLTLLGDGSFLATVTSAGNTFGIRLGATGDLLSGPFNLTGPENVSLSNGGLLSTNFGVTIFDAFGKGFEVSGQIALPTLPDSPVVAAKLLNGTVAIAWSTTVAGSSQLWHAILREDGTFATSPTAIDATGSINRTPAIVATSEGYTIGYIDNSLGNPDVKLAYVNLGGAVVGSVMVSADAATEEGISLTLFNGNIIASWGDNTFIDTDIRQALLPERFDGSVTSIVTSEGGNEDSSNPIVVVVSDILSISLYNDLTTSQVVATKTWIATSKTGDASNDVYTATRGVERIELGDGIDTLSYAASTAAVSVTIDGFTKGRGGFAESDVVLTSVENLTGSKFADRLIGNGFANSFVGGAGNDTLVGGNGSDTLIGGIGRDAMRGGNQADVFVFNTQAETGKGTARDVIFDFLSAQDDISLVAIDANTKVAGNQAFLFKTSTPAANAVWFKTVGADAIVSGDTNGDRIADFEIMLKGVSVVIATDFLL